MAHWHEVTRIRGSLSRYSVDRQTRQIVRPSEENPALFEAYYERQETPSKTEYPDGWIQLWPRCPISAWTQEEARDKALLQLEIVASRQQDAQFEKRPCPVPIHRKKIGEIQSPTHRAFAWIVRHSDTRYEVRYFGALVGDDEDGWRLPVPEIKGLPVPPGFEMLTLADDLESTLQIAASELAQIAAGGKIKSR